MDANSETLGPEQHNLNEYEDLMAKLKENRPPVSPNVDRSKIDTAALEKDMYVVQVTLPTMIEAHCYKDGLRGKRQDYAKAMELFHKAAEMGNTEAQYNLGVLYGSAKNGPVNFAKALHYFKMAASQPLFHLSGAPRLGVALAHNSLGNYYGNGLGVKRDIDKAFRHYKLSAEGEEPSGMSNLGVAYVNGEGTPVNMQKAIEIYTKAAEKNHPVAQYNLGTIYAGGRPGVEKNVRLARHWYSKAAANNYSLATVALAMLEDSSFGSSLGPLRKAAESGVAEAMCLLGVAYEEGIDGQDPDVEQALHWFQKAAKQKLPMAQFRLGLLYLDKIPTSVEPKRISKGVQCIRDAAQLNVPQAQLMLSEYYRYGDYGIKRDIAKANIWRSKAEENDVEIPRASPDQKDQSDIEFEQLLHRIQKWELSQGLTDNNDTKPITNQERILRYSLEKSFDDPERAKEFNEEHKIYEEVAEKCRTRVMHPNSPNNDTEDRYSMEKLSAYANTRVGDIMIAAKQHNLRAFGFLLDGEIGGFVYELFQAYKLCDIVCSIPDQVVLMGPEIIKEFILRNPRDAEAKFILAMLSARLKQPWSTVIPIMDECVQLRPQESAFYQYRGSMKAFAKRYEDAISDFDVAVQILGPSDGYSVYYMRAASKRQKVSTAEAALLDYQVYLEHAPPEDRKIPEALYGMAYCYIKTDEEKVAEFYNRGLEAEAKRLPIFPPIDFPLKRMVESLLKMSSISSKHIKKCPISMCTQQANKACGACNKIWYCSREHQKAHWKEHKRVCGKK
ncbi:hypothetical protein BC936DRAFT_140834 [Jimgerdemannia flammicorona]|uniref:MYND-type domain-containing protein n=1 Tax=Jimgerdemannia flammicorona TaxID=994334 RepID=A0A433A3D6_9FUNG|nr:hypothetical protein BC936DRAFT_140834 [Jimgerdemannia flammicorona]